ncbi:MAG: riboflavin biosynthesis protein RibF [Pseudomonadota bacterium]
MTLLRLHTLPHTLTLPPMAVTIGNFDGVHLGHQTMIRTLKDTAQQQGLKTLVMLFEPQPQEFFRLEQAPPRITSWREKVELIQQLGIDYVLLVKFDHTFRSLTAHNFADLLKHRLNARTLVIGDDFRFGCDRAGDLDFLKRYGFPVASMPTIEVDGERVSSTRIRACLLAGNFQEAARLLGRPYSITGRIQYGDQIGRTIDFPTANVALNRLTPCLHGIYGVEMTTISGSSLMSLIQGGIKGYSTGSYFGAGHIGTRPALEGIVQRTWRLEIHLPHATANLYGKRVRITFFNFLHGEKNYPSFQALKEGIHDDVQRLLHWRQQHPNPPQWLNDQQQP